MTTVSILIGMDYVDVDVTHYQPETASTFDDPGEPEYIEWESHNSLLMELVGMSSELDEQITELVLAAYKDDHNDY